MSAHLQRAIDELMKLLMALSARVEDSVRRAILSLEEKDPELAAEVIKNDEEIDKQEIDIEEECLKIFALHQPVAIDLRYLVAVLKINNDLERIGDLSQNIAKAVGKILERPVLSRLPDEDIIEIYGKVKPMLKKSLDSIVNLDAEAARQVLAADDEVDTLHREFAQSVIRQIKKTPSEADEWIHYLNIARHLERIADHATNIAEDVIYMINGEIVRHGVGM